MKVHQKYFRSFDGTKIGYQVVGRGHKKIILCNGLGGTMLAWSPIYKHFGKQYKFITWDYRGLFTSDKPKNLNNLDMKHHCQDLACLIKRERITKAVFAGWSMGVQVCLEFYRKHKSLYHGMILINGTSGYPFDTALNSPLAKYVIPQTNKLLKIILPSMQPKLRPIAKLVIDSNEFIKIVAKLGMINKNLDSTIFKQVAKDMIKTDLSLYSELLNRLNQHDASQVLGQIRKPTLIMAGTKDIMTPSKMAINMSKSIKNSELFVLNNASHYSILEFPEMINSRIAQFLEENNF
ncbi:MAG: alpha/beta hydrolase [bacterium]|nr:alpha/beta hydrolase [bacterium]